MKTRRSKAKLGVVLEGLQRIHFGSRPKPNPVRRYIALQVARVAYANQYWLKSKATYPTVVAVLFDLIFLPLQQVMLLE